MRDATKASKRLKPFSLLSPESMVPMAMLSPSSADGTLLDGDAGLSNAAVFMDGDELEPTISSLQSVSSYVKQSL